MQWSLSRLTRSSANALSRRRGADAHVVQRMSLREAKTMGLMPGCRHRYGHLVLPSGSFGIIPDALTWSEDEERSHRDLRALIAEVN
jgi:hypothetical protein